MTKTIIQYIPTICPYCGCGCGLNLVTVDGKVKGVEPWKRSPVNEGKLCPKGNFSYEFIHHPERLKKPLIKDKNGFREAGWNETLEILSNRLKTIKDDDPDAMAFQASARCTNEDNYLLQKFARVVIGTNNINNCADLCHGPSVAGLSLTLGSGAMTNPIQDLEDSKCILIIGSNPLEGHPLAGRRILRAKKKGAKLIVVDPRHTPTARQAHLYLPIKPGTDIALINSIMHVILKEGLEDKDFIEKRTKNFAEFEKTIKDYLPSKAAIITGIKEESIIKTALLYGNAEKASIVYCLGITEHHQGTDNVKSLANLALLTGNIGKRGTGINPLRGQNNVQGVCDMGTFPYFYPGYQKVALDNVRENIEAEWCCSGLNNMPGLQMMEIIESIDHGHVKGLYIMGENPMVSDPDVDHLQHALNRLDLLVVQDLFLTETAEVADFVLPAVCWAEKDGTFTNTERRVQTIRKATDPPGYAREDWVIIRDLAQRMGSKQFDYESSAQIFDEIRRVTPQYAGMDIERLRKPEGIQWPCPNEKHPGTPILYREEFPTSDGKAYFRPVSLREQVKNSKSELSFLLTTGRVIFHYHTGSMTRRSQTLENQASEPYVEINTEDADKLGIKDGETVKIKNKNKHILIKAKVTSDIGQGIVFIPFHYAECRVNMLTSKKSLDPISKMPDLKSSQVKIEKIG